MHIPYLDSHQKSAVGLYRQRRNLVRQRFAAVDAMASLEHRLRVHLYVLAEAGFDEEQPKKAEAWFVATACRILRGEGDAHRAALEAVDDDEQCTEAVIDAVSLFPPADEKVLLDLYEQREDLRQMLFQIWRRTGAELATGLVNASELQRVDADLQAAALRYGASRPEVSVEPFRAYYAPVLRDPGAARNAAPSVLEAAVWGGLLRGDGDAQAVLRRALEQIEPGTGAGLLRLMALTGAAEFEPVLQERAHGDPAHAQYLLGLYGRRSAMVSVVEALDVPQSMESAAQSWRWLTGEDLPTKPRLGVVSKEETHAVAQGGRIPDALHARNRWMRLEPAFPRDGRWVAGRCLNLQGLVRAARRWAGEAGADVLDLLALHTGGRTCLDPEGWIALRDEGLVSLGVSMDPELPADLDQLDPWEHGHYA